MFDKQNDRQIKCIVCDADYCRDELRCPKCGHTSLLLTKQPKEAEECINTYKKEKEIIQQHDAHKESLTPKGDAHNKKAKDIQEEGKKSLISIKTIIIIFMVAGILAAMGIRYLSNGSNYVKHNYEDISFMLPDTWLDTTEWKNKYPDKEQYLPYEDDSYECWKPEDFNNTSVSFKVIDADHDKDDYLKYLDGGLTGLFESDCKLIMDNAEYEISEHDGININGTECYYCQYTSNYSDKEYDSSSDFSDYLLYIPSNNGHKVIKLEYSYEVGHGSFDRKEYVNNENEEAICAIREKLIKSITQDKASKKTKNTEGTGYVDKQYEDKDWVFNASYDKNIEVDSYQVGSHTIYASEISAPFININSSDAFKANERIKRNYFDVDVLGYNEDSTEHNKYSISRYNVSYFDDVLSIEVDREHCDLEISDEEHKYFEEGFTFNLKTGKRMTFYETMLEQGITQDKSKKMIEDAITEKEREQYNYQDASTQEEKDRKNGYIEKSIDDFFEYFDKYGDYFIDSDGTVFVNQSFDLLQVN